MHFSTKDKTLINLIYSGEKKPVSMNAKTEVVINSDDNFVWPKAFPKSYEGNPETNAILSNSNTATQVKIVSFNAHLVSDEEVKNIWEIGWNTGGEGDEATQWNMPNGIPKNVYCGTTKADVI